MSGGYLQPFHPAMPNMPIPPYPGFGGPGFSPFFDGRYAHNTQTTPYLNNLFNIGNMMQEMIYQEAGMRQMYDSMYSPAGPMAFAHNFVNPLMAQANQIYQSAMGNPNGNPNNQSGGHPGGYSADSGGGMGKTLKHTAGGVVIGAAIGSVIPGVGTAIGAVVGGVIGFGSSLF